MYISELYNEFLNILNKSPMKLKRKIMGWKVIVIDTLDRNERLTDQFIVHI